MPDKKQFSAKVIDSNEFGGIYPDAEVIIYGFSAYSQLTGELVDGDSAYTMDTWLDKLTCRASYYPNRQTLDAGGYRSRPISQADESAEGGKRDVIEIDLELPQVKQMLASNIELSEKLLNICEFYVRQLCAK